MDLSRLQWRKSSYSTGQGGNCVEVGTVWKKSSYSGGQGGNCVEVGTVWKKSSYSGSQSHCVEVADFPHAHALRDSKNPGRGAFLFSPGEWEAFIAAAKADEL